MGQTFRRARSAAIDDQVLSLDPRVDEAIRADLRELLFTLRRTGNIRAVMLAMCNLGLRLMSLIYGTVNRHRPSDNLNECILGALPGNPKMGKPGLDLIPNEVATLLHVVRVNSNASDHDAERLPLTVERAEKTLEAFLDVLDWHYVLNPKGPKLPSLCLDDRALAVSLLSGALTRLERSWSGTRKDAALRGGVARALVARPETRRRRLVELRAEHAIDDGAMADLRSEVRAELQAAVQELLREERGDRWRTLYDRLFPDPKAAL